MAAYIVTFEVGAASKTAFIEALKSFTSYCPINATSWAITANETKAVDIANKLKVSIGASDRIFVIRSGTDSAWVNSYGIANDDWLKKYL